MFTIGPGCGFLLWKNLWTVWKTICFQGIFPGISGAGGVWKSLWTLGITACFSTARGWLCCGGLLGKDGEKPWLRLAFVAFSGRSDDGRMGRAPTNFVKNRQRPSPLPLLRRMYQFPTLGNTVGDIDQSGGTLPCREKWRSAV